MKLTFAAAALAVLAMTGVVEAGNPHDDDESALTLDLQDALGTVYYIKCKNGEDILRCQFPSVWEDGNLYPGLQSAVLRSGSDRWEPDTMLLG